MNAVPRPGTPNPGRALSQRAEWIIVLVLCLLGATRVALYSAVFPLFSQVDEWPHYDLVIRYSTGRIPDLHSQNYGLDTSRVLALYGSPEYDYDPATHRVLHASPPALLPPEERAGFVTRTQAFWGGTVNHEAHSPPVYYALAAIWYRLGSTLGLEDPQRVYWIRFLNAPFFGLLILQAWMVCRRHNPRHPTIVLGVPILLAAFPQDVLYSINPDVLSAPLALLALDLGLRWRAGGGAGLAGGAGAAAAAAVLVKVTNVALLLPLAWLAVTRWRGVPAERRRTARSLAVMVLALAVPVVAWSLRNALELGDPTGTASKLEALGWTHKPLGQMFDHPILTPSGLTVYLRDMGLTLWRGELTWHGERMRSVFADAVYLLTSVVLLVLATWGWVIHPRGRHVFDRAVATTYLIGLAAYLAVLAVLSMRFNFTATAYPSPAYPYLTSGRLMLGALVPMLVLMAGGAALLDRGSRSAEGTRNTFGWGLPLIVDIAVIALVSEWVITRPVMRSPYNLFNL